jgi:D-alanyl-lipoteichoic acid acyltransferase DltB (MBOAT superfamily)
MRTVLHKVEIALYAAIVIYFLCVLISEGWRFCQRLVQHNITVPGLQSGLIGTQVDVSDHQWKEFRASMPLLSAVMAVFVVCSRTVQAVAPQLRVSFYLLFTLIFLAVLHGACLLYVVSFVAAGYVIAKATASYRYCLLLVWAWHCALFLLVRVYEGLPFEMFGAKLAPLDHYRGMLRWHIHYNLVMLRMLSFACDYRWQLQQQPGRLALPPDTPAQPDQDLRTRSELWQDPKSYNFAAYLAYSLYPPLYIAGPISTFNAFASQLQAPASNLTATAVFRYFLRASGCWLCMEIITHQLWFMAIVRHRLWEQLAAAEGHSLTPLDMCLVPWWIMIIFWLKFLVIWRFFRFWALADGMDVPENMTRCICNNYDIAGFWKNWHASYNQWLVRSVSTATAFPRQCHSCRRTGLIP